MGQMVQSTLMPTRTPGTTFGTAAGAILTLPLSSSLLAVLGIVFLIWYVQYLWSRRYIYYRSYMTPGPFALPILGNVFQFFNVKATETPQIIGDISLRYNGIWTLWLGTKLHFVVSDVKYLKIILNHPEAMNKNYMYKFVQCGVGESIFSTFSLSRWKAHRKIILPSFSQKLLEEFFEIFVEQSEIFCKVVEKQAGNKDFKLINAIEKCTLDIIAESAMGVKTNYQTIDEDPEFCHLIHKLFTTAMVRVFNVFWHPDIVFYNIPPGKFSKAGLKKSRSFLQKVIQERRTEFEKSLKDSKHDYEGRKGRTVFLDSLLETIYQENVYWTEKELIDEVFLFMVGGYDTTARSLGSILMALGMHPDIQDKFHQEVLDKVGPHRKVVYSDIANLKYCERVVKESLRLFSSTFIGRHAAEDIDLDGDYIIPKGSSIIADLKTASRNPKFWKDPLIFNPDRFLPENENPGQFLTFSLGPRNCIGKRYAMLEMITFLATFIRKYKTHCEYKSVAEVEMKLSGVLTPAHGFKTTIELRNP